jgi:YVTN family beta-propeller protein
MHGRSPSRTVSRPAALAATKEDRLVTSRSTRSALLRASALVLAASLVATLAMAPRHGARAAAEKYFSPYAVAVAPDGARAYVAGKTGDEVAVVDPARGAVVGKIGGIKEPTGLALSADGATLYASSYGANLISVIDARSAKLTGRLVAGRRPSGLVLAPDGKRLYVCNRMSDDISVIDLVQKKEVARIPAVREPVHAAVTPDGALLFVANLLPLGRNDDAKLAADVTVVDTAALKAVGQIRLPTGCTDVGQIVMSPDGQFAYVVSVLARFLVPPTQITRGWINTNALTIIDVAARQELATVLLDELDRGAANPFGIVCSPDGAKLYVSHTGCHEITTLDRAKLHAIIEQTPAEKRADLSRDLTFLYRNGVTTKYRVAGRGPKGIALTPDGSELLVCNYYSESLTIHKPGKGEVKATVTFTDPREPDLARQGEMLFFDADLCFQQWQSCGSCHPDGRSDGLRWDLLNDGLGNPKNAKSLLLADKTPPSMAHGVRDRYEVAVEAGIKYILFRQPESNEVEAISAYLASMKPEASPKLDESGGLSAAAKRGKKLFDSPRTRCAECHPAPLFTDLQAYDTATRSELDSESEFDTPTLVEVYRSGPYLHDGNAVTLKEVLLDRNAEGKHGVTKDLKPEEIDDLIEYVLSL